MKTTTDQLAESAQYASKKLAVQAEIIGLNLGRVSALPYTLGVIDCGNSLFQKW